MPGRSLTLVCRGGPDKRAILEKTADLLCELDRRDHQDAAAPAVDQCAASRIWFETKARVGHEPAPGLHRLPRTAWRDRLRADRNLAGGWGRDRRNDI